MTAPRAPGDRTRTTRWQERLVLAAYMAGWRFVRFLPEWFAYRAGDLLADLSWRRRGPKVRQLEENLRWVRAADSSAEIRSLSRQGMRSYWRYWCDVFRLSDWSTHRIISAVHPRGDDVVRAALTEQRGVVMFLGHLGNWDLAGAWATLRVAPVTTVAERLRPAGLFAQFVRFREELGMRVLPVDAGPRLLLELLRTVRGGGFVPLLADRDLTGSGVEVNFFGGRVRMAPGPATLALRGDAALFVVTMHHEQINPRARHRQRMVLTWHPVQTGDMDPKSTVAVRVVTQRCADILAEAITSHPTEWHMLQPIFGDQLVPERDHQAPRGEQ
ncbi:MAG: phosphatidylinositol mannoside acyltransferase [Actinomycetota bacterium]